MAEIKLSVCEAQLEFADQMLADRPEAGTAEGVLQRVLWESMEKIMHENNHFQTRHLRSLKNTSERQRIELALLERLYKETMLLAYQPKPRIGPQYCGSVRQEDLDDFIPF